MKKKIQIQDVPAKTRAMLLNVMQTSDMSKTIPETVGRRFSGVRASQSGGVSPSLGENAQTELGSRTDANAKSEGVVSIDKLYERIIFILGFEGIKPRQGNMNGSRQKTKTEQVESIVRECWKATNQQKRTEAKRDDSKMSNALGRSSQERMELDIQEALQVGTTY